MIELVQMRVGYYLQNGYKVRVTVSSQSSTLDEGTPRRNQIEDYFRNGFMEGVSINYPNYSELYSEVVTRKLQEAKLVRFIRTF